MRKTLKTIATVSVSLVLASSPSLAQEEWQVAQTFNDLMQFQLELNRQNQIMRRDSLRTAPDYDPCTAQTSDCGDPRYDKRARARNARDRDNSDEEPSYRRNGRNNRNDAERRGACTPGERQCQAGVVMRCTHSDRTWTSTYERC